MNKSIIIGAVLGAVAVTATGTIAMMGGNEPSYAEVLKVEPVTKTINTPRQECQQETVSHKKPTKDPNQITGSVVGAVVGGLLGNQVGGGNGKKLATVAGAAAGGYAGNKTQEKLQNDNTYTTTESRCQTVTDSAQKVIGYDVKYQIDDRVDSVRMTERPADRIPVENGKLVLN